MNDALNNMGDGGTMDSGLTYDPNFDYANAMRNYLLEGGSREDA